MRLLDLTLPTPAENLACDEALLDACDSNIGDEVLRFWEAGDYFVVVGYSNKIHTEVNLTECERRGVPVLRRCSGGGTVVQGPGCLNYALVLKIPESGPLATLTKTNEYIMRRHKNALSAFLSKRCHPERSEGSQPLTTEICRHTTGGLLEFRFAQNDKSGKAIAVQGHTDLTLDGRKFSGNSQRRKRRALLFHGSFLLNFDLSLIEALLPLPSRQPSYRRERTHNQFLTNLAVAAPAVKTALTKCWDAHGVARAPDIGPLVSSKYATTDWNFRC